MKNHPHHSVLLNEIVSAFENLNLHTLVDGTLGAGGHSEAILQAHPETTQFLGIDQDPVALSLAKNRLSRWKEKTRFHQGNFSSLSKILEKEDVGPISAMVLDFGVSSMQLDTAERGFSFQKSGPLDMRMDPNNPLTAEIIVNEWTEQEIGRILRKYGEVERWRAIARTIVAGRPIHTTKELSDLLLPLFPIHLRRSIHPLTLPFQALRIAVNSELRVIEEVLPQALAHLEPGGRLAVISFHRLEDRIVKNMFRYAASDKENTAGLGTGIFIDRDPEVKLITRKAVKPTEEEISDNPRSRSARLRIIEKL